MGGQWEREVGFSSKLRLEWVGLKWRREMGKGIEMCGGGIKMENGDGEVKMEKGGKNGS